MDCVRAPLNLANALRTLAVRFGSSAIPLNDWEIPVGFAVGAASFQRFFVSGQLDPTLTDELLADIQTRAFGRLPSANDDTQAGWIGGRHLLDTDIEAETINFGRFLHMALRIDRFRIPPAVLKAYIRQEEDVAREASGRDFLSRGEKKQARETALTRAEQEARSGAFRRMSAYPVLIDLERGMAYLGNVGTQVGDRFMRVFSETFGKHLEPAGPEAIAGRIMHAAKSPRALENLAKAQFVRPPDGFESAGPAIGGDVKFLGRELLTWLWHQIDADETPLHVRGADSLAVMIDRSLRLKCEFGLSGATMISADGPTQLPEAKAALRIGKTPVKAGLVLGAPAGEFRFTLDAERFTVSGLKLPEDAEEKDARVRASNRFEQIADMATLLDAVFETFLLRRVARDWSGEQRTIAAWAAGQRGAEQRATA